MNKRSELNLPSGKAILTVPTKHFGYGPHYVNNKLALSVDRRNFSLEQIKTKQNKIIQLKIQFSITGKCLISPNYRNHCFVPGCQKELTGGR